MAQLIPITTPTRVFEDRTQTIYAAANIPNSQLMVTSSEDRMVRLWDLKTGQVLKQMEGHTSDVMGLAVSRDGLMIATSDENGELIAWQAGTGESLTKAVKVHDSAVRSLDFAPDGKCVMTASSVPNDQLAKCWDTKTWDQIGYWACGSTVRCVRYARSEVPIRVAVATDQDIQIYTLSELQTKFKGHSHGTLSLAWSPDSTRLLSGGDDHDPSIREWDTSSWTQVGDPWMGHTYKVNSIVIHSSGTHAVSASSDNTVRLWQLSDKQTIAIFQHASSVFCAAFSADGMHILSGGYDKRVAVWTAPKGTLPADASGKEMVLNVPGFDSEVRESYISNTEQSLSESKAEQSLSKAQQSVLEAEQNLSETLIESDFQTGSPDSKSLQPVLTTGSSDFRSQQFLSTTPSFDSKSQQFLSTTQSFDSKSQQFLSTTSSFDSRSQRSSSTTVQSVSKAEQSLSNEWSVSKAEESQISKAEQFLSKESLTKAEQSVTDFERSVLMAEQAVSKTLVITTAELLAITQTIRTASITGDLSTAANVLTQEITADAKNFASYANRSFVMARKLDWGNAFQDATKSLAIRPSLAGYIAKGIALCGKQLLDDARTAFDMAFTFTHGNMDATVFLYLIKAIALFNANRHEESMLRVQQLAADPSADPLTCGVVVASLRVKLGTVAFNGAHHSEAVEHFTAAVEACGFLAKSAAPAACEAFTVLFGWDVEALWQTSNKKLIRALLGAGMLGEAFESYRFAMDASDEATKTNLHSWILTLSL
ncbi:WD40-repeat-containing domain protein [Suillus placidus]|uniref:WD40-repeat-containing domain protein n=1 Tax=Suillus placidus TaxID=48579 RepID=A0A9P6ZMH5_9AGAM|nr:WD40-repeat-containing domain protein [Suillus placidus]